jgi:hypothetical protein
MRTKIRLGVVTAKDRLERLTPAERLAALRRLQKIQKGEISVPLRCGYCRSTTLALDDDKHLAVCGACGKRSHVDGLHRARQKEIEAIVVGGELQ